MANASSTLQDIKEEEDNVSEMSVGVASSVIVAELTESERPNEGNKEAEAVVMAAEVDDKLPEIESRILGLGLEDGKGGMVINGLLESDTQEELLLPPLPDVVTKTASVYQEETVGNMSSVSGSSSESVDIISPELNVRSCEQDESFDLSKALEIPTNATTDSPLNRSSSNHNMSMHLPQNMVPANVTLPKVAPKRRYSNSLLTQALNQEALLLSTGSSPQIYANSDFPLHKTSTRSSGHTTSSSSGTRNKSRSNSNAPLFPSFESAQITMMGSNQNSNNAYNITEVSEKRFSDLKRLIVGQNPGENTSNSSGLSSPSLHSPNDLNNSPHYEEMLYKPPAIPGTTNPANAGGRSRSNSNLNVITNMISSKMKGSSDESSDTRSLASSELNIPKRAPLLRRASSAILRKRSLRQNTNDAEATSPVNDLRIASLDLDSIARLESRNKKNLFINAEGSRSNLSVRSQSIESTPLNSPMALRSGFSNDPIMNRQPSFGSKVKRGFTRIISSGNSSARKQSSADKISPTNSNGNGIDSMSMNFSPETNSVNEFVEEHNCDKNNLLRKRSSSVFLQKRVSRTGKRNSNTNSILSDRGNSNVHLNKSKTTHSNDDADLDEQDFIIADADMEALAKKLPIITITEKFGANNTTPLQQQSNVWYYKASFDEWKQTTNKKPSNASLKRYIDTLIEQQTIEDARFQVLEQNFKDSGWVSNQELGYLRQKRVIINRQWAERISFYQNKLEE